MKTRAYLLMLFVVAVWGCTFVLIKDALADATPLAFNLVRMTLAFGILGLAYHRHWKQITRSQVAAGAVVGFFLAGGYQFQTAGLAHTTPSKSAFITGMVVVLVPLLSAIPILRPKGAHAPRWNALLGALIAFVGILLLTLPPGNGLLPDFASASTGDLITFGCTISFAFHCLALGHLSPRVPFQTLALLQIGFCAVFMAISMPIFEHPHIHLTPRLAISLGVAALLATAAAFSIQSWAQSILPATHTALILTLEPVFAWITSYFFLGEKLGLRPAIGAVMILSGIALTELIPQPQIPTAHEA